MAGVQTLQCEFWLETVMEIVWIHSYYVAVPGIGVLIAAFGAHAWDRYATRKVSSFSLTSWLFWLLWLATYLMTGTITWLVYNEGGMLCEQFILIPLYSFTAFVFLAWPLTLFILGNRANFLVTMFIMIFLVLWFIGLFIANVILNQTLIAIHAILHFLIVLWLIHNAVWMFFTWSKKCPGFKDVGGAKSIYNKALADTGCGGASPGVFDNNNQIFVNNNVNDTKELEFKFH